MLTLAVENSYRNFSAALLDGDQSLGLVSEAVDSRDHSRIFELIGELFAVCGVDRQSIARYVVGRGPGNYAGMRTAFSLVQGLSLPHAAQCFAVSSAAAIAWRVLLDYDYDRVAVVGDARRQSYWMGIFSLSAGSLVGECDWKLYSREGLERKLVDDVAVASPEMQALSERIDLSGIAADRRIERNLQPSPVDLALIALDRIQAGIGQEPLDPLYMHPAV